jgi:hypothetical protein
MMTHVRDWCNDFFGSRNHMEIPARSATSPVAQPNQFADYRENGLRPSSARKPWARRGDANKFRGTPLPIRRDEQLAIVEKNSTVRFA